jgi:hypothetical protein
MYCVFHQKAYSNILEKFAVWKRALSVSWKEYLNAVAENSYTGTWSKEVAMHLLKTEE